MKFRPVKPLSSKGKGGVRTYSLKDRKSKVSIKDVAGRHKKGASFAAFFDSLPDILAAKDLKAVVSAIIKAHKRGKTVALGMGAHVIKTGLSPLIINLMKKGILNAVAMNGAGIVHDFELAYSGCTSEDVESEIGSGKFGMAKETGELLNTAIKNGAKKKTGIGKSVGEMILKSDFPYKDLSILATGVKLDIPVTVHVALGTDIIHIHPKMDGAATGAGSILDFELFTGVVSSLENGVFINIGSAVILPEVFLKALSLSRNLGYKVKNFTAVNMDFIQHYRPVTNVVKRPTSGGGRGYTLTGHHEIMVPLLYAGIIEELDG